MSGLAQPIEEHETTHRYCLDAALLSLRRVLLALYYRVMLETEKESMETRM